MEISHTTPFASTLDPILDKDGSEARIAVIKATYEIASNRGLIIAEEQVPICLVDRYAAEPGKSSIVSASDGAYFKPATDIIVVGNVYAPKAKKTKCVDASLSVGRLRKVIRVFGDRKWSYSQLFGVKKSSPTLFTEMPLSWERAFGGADTFHKNPKHHRWEPRNPIGTGFRITKSAESLDGLPLPNLENPADLIGRWDSHPIPCGVGHTANNWIPRIKYAGTFDENWEKYRMPILPQDFDYRFFNSAPPDQIYPGYLLGGEVVRAENLSRYGIEEFQLPKANVLFRARSRGKLVSVDGLLDTVIFRFEERKVILIWRAKYEVGMNEPADSATAHVAFQN